MPWARTPATVPPNPQEIVSAAILDDPPYETEILTVSFAVTDLVLIENVDEVLPAGMTTNAGVFAVESSLEIVSLSPPAGAADDRVTVPMLDLPPFTEAGLRVRDDKAGGVTVTCTACDVLPSFAVSVMTLTADTGQVLTLNGAEVFPPAIVTDAGTDAAEALLVSLI